MIAYSYRHKEKKGDILKVSSLERRQAQYIVFGTYTRHSHHCYVNGRCEERTHVGSPYDVQICVYIDTNKHTTLYDRLESKVHDTFPQCF